MKNQAVDNLWCIKDKCTFKHVDMSLITVDSDIDMKCVAAVANGK